MSASESFRKQGKGTYTEERKEILKRYRVRERAKATALPKTLELLARNEDTIPAAEIERYFQRLSPDELKEVMGWLRSF